MAATALYNISSLRLRSSRMRLWISDCSCALRVLKIHPSGYVQRRFGCYVAGDTLYSEDIKRTMYVTRSLWYKTSVSTVVASLRPCVYTSLNVLTYFIACELFGLLLSWRNGRDVLRRPVCVWRQDCTLEKLYAWGANVMSRLHSRDVVCLMHECDVKTAL